MNKIDVLNKHAAGQTFNEGSVYDGFTDSIYDAMNEYAQVMAISFAEWIRENIEDSNPWKWAGYGEYTTPELFTLYKQLLTK